MLAYKHKRLYITQFSSCGSQISFLNSIAYCFYFVFVTEQGLSPYEKKKYVWKMLYIYMLGYDVDFGHMEAVSLISAPKYPEKQVCLQKPPKHYIR